ncbi:MAG: type II toxin-antitoxin system YafQ family toxin [Bulleidia sp.]|jgi:mRNA interferase YafQ|nr:type II toxin-antitoxin system YafQ family toxin [Bulleidia sp.]
MLKVKFTSQFKKDYKIAIKRGFDKEKMRTVIELLCLQKELPVKYMDHSLVNSRNYKNMRELHIEPDWFLVYQIESEELILKLIRTGSHSDLF